MCCLGLVMLSLSEGVGGGIIKIHHLSPVLNLEQWLETQPKTLRSQTGLIWSLIIQVMKPSNFLAPIQVALNSKNHHHHDVSSLQFPEAPAV